MERYRYFIGKYRPRAVDACGHIFRLYIAIGFDFAETLERTPDGAVFADCVGVEYYDYFIAHFQFV